MNYKKASFHLQNVGFPFLLLLLLLVSSFCLIACINNFYIILGLLQIFFSFFWVLLLFDYVKVVGLNSWTVIVYWKAQHFLILMEGCFFLFQEMNNIFHPQLLYIVFVHLHCLYNCIEELLGWNLDRWRRWKLRRAG